MPCIMKLQLNYKSGTLDTNWQPPFFDLKKEPTLKTMNINYLQKPLLQALAEHGTGCFAKNLDEAERQAVRMALKAMVTTLRQVYLHTPAVYKKPTSHVVARELEGFCKKLTYASKETLATSWFEDHGGTVSPPLRDSLHLLAICLGSHAVAKGAVFIYFELCCEENKMTFYVNSSVATLHNPGEEDTLLQIALGEVHRLGGRIKADRTSGDKGVYRLAVMVDHNAGV